MTDLAAELSDLPARRGRAPWPGYEYVRGWGVFGLPLDSGHVLALRVFAESDFAPYRTIWHRDPEGRWSIHVDGPRLETACPRYYGAACDYVGFGRISVDWAGPMSLRIRLDRPALEWTLTARETPQLRAANAAGRRLPDWTWRPAVWVRARELLAEHALGMGDLRLSGTMPSGHWGVLMPKRMYTIDEASAALDGTDLGRPARLEACPRIGDVTVPARGVLAVGQAAWKIRDRAEYEWARAATVGLTGRTRRMRQLMREPRVA